LLKNQLSAPRGMNGTLPLKTNGYLCRASFRWGSRRKFFRSAEMRKTILTLVAALAVAFTISSPASAGGKHHPHKATIVAGVVVGTIVGISVYEGSSWLGANTLAASSTGAAVTGGFVAGVATAALIHAATTPCQGFHAIFQGAGCKNGRYVGPKRAAILWW
jgi:hypothetical protein